MSGLVVPYLVDSIFLEKIIHSAVSQAVVKCVSDFKIDFLDIICVDTDNASSMKKAHIQVLVNIFLNSVHVTCSMHIMDLVAEAFRKPFVT